MNLCGISILCRGAAVGCVINIHVGVAVGGTCEVVGPIDAAMEDGGAASGITNIHRSATVRCGLLITHRGHLPTTIDVAENLTSQDIDGGGTVYTAG